MEDTSLEDTSLAPQQVPVYNVSFHSFIGAERAFQRCKHDHMEGRSVCQLRDGLRRGGKRQAGPSVHLYIALSFHSDDADSLVMTIEMMSQG